jgi:hypothetical protein
LSSFFLSSIRFYRTKTPRVFTRDTNNAENNRRFNKHLFLCRRHHKAKNFSKIKLFHIVFSFQRFILKRTLPQAKSQTTFGRLPSRARGQGQLGDKITH